MVHGKIEDYVWFFLFMVFDGANPSPTILHVIRCNCKYKTASGIQNLVGT